MYASWTTVATILNFAIALVANKWDGFGISPSVWGGVMLLIAAAINVAMLLRERNTIYPLVFVWASLAICVKNSSDPVVGPLSLVAACCMLVTTWYYDSIYKSAESILTQEEQTDDL